MAVNDQQVWEGTPPDLAAPMINLVELVTAE